MNGSSTHPNTTDRRRLAFAALCAAVALVAGSSTAAWADAAGGADNVVLASNQVDQSATSRVNVQVAYDPADTVANQNVASATSSCVGCRTVAVAVQVVVVEGFPSDFEPHNAAAAENNGCDSCDTLAYAYQIVVQPGVIVHLDADGQHQVQDLEAEMEGVAGSDAGLFDIVDQLDTLSAQLKSAVEDSLVRSGAPTTATAYRAVQGPPA